MHIAVLIPARHLNEILLWTLHGYAQQQLPAGHALDILVGIDGPPDSPQSQLQLPPSPHPIRLHQFPRMGAAAVRNRLAQLTQADLFIFGNADARPDPDLAYQHALAIENLPPDHLVLGDAPWEKPADPTVFDALLAETPMIFFYNQLTPGQLYDFRHAWTLNLSLRAADFHRVQGFPDALRPVYYEDLALGYRLLGPDKKAILFHPAAKVTHRHPTTLQQYLDREELLGIMAPILAQTCPQAFKQIFHATSLDQLASAFQTWTALDHSSHRFTYQRLQQWAAQSESTLPPDPAARAQLLLTVYQMHIPLKRLAFRFGFLEGLNLSDDSQWQSRQPKSLWKKVIT